MLPRRRFRFLPVRLVMRDPFRSDQRIARVTAPLLIMHGARDPTIPIVLASACSRSRMSRNNSSGFPKAATTISDNYGAIETARQFIGASTG